MSAALTARQRRAQRQRAAEEKQHRLEQAIAQLPELKQRQAEAAQRAGQGKRGQKIRDKEPRVSTSDAEARVMKMPNGGFNPACNVQLATDTESRAIVGVEVSNEGSDSAGLSEPMREQVEQRSGKQGGAAPAGRRLHAESRTSSRRTSRGWSCSCRPSQRVRRGIAAASWSRSADSEAVLAWKQRMASEEGKEIYQQRAATSETVNADLRSYRGLTQITVRGMAKAKCVALWCALAYNVMHFGTALLS